MPTSSLCITSYYKDIVYIDRLLSFLSKQTLKPNQIILFCSGVNGIEIQNNKFDIEVFTQTQLATPAQARNYCANKAKEDVVIFFDIDDIPHPQKVEITMSTIKDYDFLLHSYDINDTTFEIIDSADIITYTNLVVDANSTNISCHDKHIHHAHIAVKKRVLDNIRYNENIYYFKKEDGRFCQDLLINNYNGIYVDIPLVSYSI